MILNQTLWWIVRFNSAALPLFVEEHAQWVVWLLVWRAVGSEGGAPTPAACAQWRLHVSPAPRNPLLPGTAGAGTRMPRRFSSHRRGFHDVHGIGSWPLGIHDTIHRTAGIEGAKRARRMPCFASTLIVLLQHYGHY